MDDFIFGEILDLLDETVIVFDKNGEYKKVFGEVFTKEIKEGMIGKNIKDSLPQETVDFFMSKIRMAYDKDEIIEAEYQISDLMNISLENDFQKEATRFFKAKIFPVKNGSDRYIVWAAYDISEQKTLEYSFKANAVEDPVTGVYNRRYLFKELNNFFQRFLRGSNSYSVLMISLDNAEKLSDRYGRELTENIYISLLAVIKETLRTTDLLASNESEDFIILLPDTPSKGASMMGERLRNSISGHIFEIDGEQFGLTASFGCSEVSQNDTSYDNVINRSEIALYQARHGGGDTVKRLDYVNWKK